MFEVECGGFGSKGGANAKVLQIHQLDCSALDVFKNSALLYSQSFDNCNANRLTPLQGGAKVGDCRCGKSADSTTDPSSLGVTNLQQLKTWMNRQEFLS